MSTPVEKCGAERLKDVALGVKEAAIRLNIEHRSSAG
jgi:hypothetical protein